MSVLFHNYSSVGMYIPGNDPRPNPSLKFSAMIPMVLNNTNRLLVLYLWSAWKNIPYKGSRYGVR
jgi:hypothetical protein